MQDVFYIDMLDQAIALLKPRRIELLRSLDTPRSCPELAKAFGETAQSIYYHIKALENAGLVEKVDEQRARGIMEGYYQAKARSYWLSPALVGAIGGEQPTQDQTSLRFLLSMAEEIHHDIGHLGQQVGKPIPSLGLSAQISLPDGQRRAEFLDEVQSLFQHLAQKYGSSTPSDSAANFRLMLICYPQGNES